MTQYLRSVEVGGDAFEKLPHFVDKDRRGDIKLLREIENWGWGRFSAGDIIDADPPARHATPLLIRSHYNVSTLSLSLINDTLPSFKSMKLQTESVNCNANPLRRCTAKSSTCRIRWMAGRGNVKQAKFRSQLCTRNDTHTQVAFWRLSCLTTWKQIRWQAHMTGQH